MKNVSDSFSIGVFLRDALYFYSSMGNYAKKGIKHYWHYALVLLIFFSSALYYKTSKIKTFYTAESSYTFNFLHKKVFGDLLHYIDLLVANGEYQTVAETLRLPLATAESILTFKAQNIVHSPLHEDFTERKVPFYVVVQVENKELLPAIQQAITDYLVQHPSLRQNINIVKKTFYQELEEINQELNFWDSLKQQLLVDSISTTETMETLTPLINFYTSTINRKLHLQQQLSQQDAVILLSPFQALAHTQTPQLKKAILQYILGYIAITLVLCTFLYWYNYPADES